MVFIGWFLLIAHMLLHPVLMAGCKGKSSIAFTSHRSIHSLTYKHEPSRSVRCRGNTHRLHNTPEIRYLLYHCPSARQCPYQRLSARRYPNAFRCPKALQRHHGVRYQVSRCHARHRSLNRKKIQNLILTNYQKKNRNCYHCLIPNCYCFHLTIRCYFRSNRKNLLIRRNLCYRLTRYLILKNLLNRRSLCFRKNSMSKIRSYYHFHYWNRTNFHCSCPMKNQTMTMNHCHHHSGFHCQQIRKPQALQPNRERGRLTSCEFPFV